VNYFYKLDAPIWTNCP